MRSADIASLLVATTRTAANAVPDKGLGVIQAITMVYAPARRSRIVNLTVTRGTVRE
jgi:hypothetical protein